MQILGTGLEHAEHRVADCSHQCNSIFICFIFSTLGPIGGRLLLNFLNTFMVVIIVYSLNDSHLVYSIQLKENKHHHYFMRNNESALTRLC